MNFKQFYLGCLSHASYYLGSQREAAQDRPVSAKLYESLGNIYFTQDVKQAKSLYEKSFEIWQDLQRYNTILASDAKEPDDVRQKIEKCNAKLK